jgi:hypothetical protein
VDKKAHRFGGLFILISIRDDETVADKNAREEQLLTDEQCQYVQCKASPIQKNGNSHEETYTHRASFSGVAGRLLASAASSSSAIAATRVYASRSAGLS